MYLQSALTTDHESTFAQSFKNSETIHRLHLLIADTLVAKYIYTLIRVLNRASDKNMYQATVVQTSDPW